jgi:hypothetical protein
MGYRFNPPPNWPPPPPGWSPPPDWRPDPSWPPPPQGWQFWVLEEELAGPPPMPPVPPQPPPATQPAWRRVRAWFAGLPAWAKLLVVLLVAVLVLGLLPWLLLAGGLALAAVGIVGLLRGPLPRLKLTSRAAAVGALLLGLVGIGAGSALAVAVLNPAPPPTSSRPLVAPTTQSAPATAAATTTPPPTTAPPATTRPPTTIAKRPTTTQPPKSSAPASTARPVSLCGAPPKPLRLQLLRTRRLRARPGSGRVRLLRLHRQLLERARAHGGMPRPHLQHVGRASRFLLLPRRQPPPGLPRPLSPHQPAHQHSKQHGAPGPCPSGGAIDSRLRGWRVVEVAALGLPLPAGAPSSLPRWGVRSTLAVPT